MTSRARLLSNLLQHSITSGKQLPPHILYGSTFSPKSGLCHCQAESPPSHNALHRACREERLVISSLLVHQRKLQMVCMNLIQHSLKSMNPFPRPLIQFSLGSLCKSWSILCVSPTKPTCSSQAYPFVEPDSKPFRILGVLVF